MAYIASKVERQIWLENIEWLIEKAKTCESAADDVVNYLEEEGVFIIREDRYE